MPAWVLVGSDSSLFGRLSLFGFRSGLLFSVPNLLFSGLLFLLCSSHNLSWLVDLARREPERILASLRSPEDFPDLAAGVWLGEGLTRVVGAGGTFPVRTFPWWLGHGAWSFSGVACGDGNNSGSVDPDCSVRRRRSWSSAVNPCDNGIGAACFRS